MSNQPLRGSLESKLIGIAETLKLVLSSAVDEKDYRTGIQAVIKSIEDGYLSKKKRSKPDSATTQNN